MPWDSAIQRQARKYRQEMERREQGKASHKEAAIALEALRPVSAQPSGDSEGSAHEGSRSFMGGSGASVALGISRGHWVCL